MEYRRGSAPIQIIHWHSLISWVKLRFGLPCLYHKFISILCCHNWNIPWCQLS